MGASASWGSSTPASMSAVPSARTKEPAYLAMNPNGAGADARRRRTASCCGNRIRSFAISPASTTSPARSSRRTRTSARLAQQWMDWQLSVVGPAILGGVLGIDPHAAGQARSRRDQDLAGQDHRGDADSRHSSSAKPNTSPARSFSIRRHSGRRDVLPLSSSWCRSARRRRTSTAGTPRSQSARRSTITSAACRWRDSPLSRARDAARALHR